MLTRIARFEFLYQLKSPAFIVIFLIFFALAFLGTSIDEVTIGGGGNTNINAPYAIILATIILSIFAVFLPTALLSNAVLRDSAHGMDGILYSTPVTKTDYLIGRFLGGFAAVALCFFSVPLGIFLGSAMPWVDPETVGPFRPLDYIFAFGVFGLPNLLVPGMVMFAVANLTRSTIATYTALIAFIIIYFVSISLGQNPDYRDVIALFDPFGTGAFSEATRSWTAFERNGALPALSGTLLYNRVLWIGIGLALLALNYALFTFRRDGAKAGRRKQEKALPQTRFIPKPVSLPAAERSFGSGTARRQFLARTGFEMRSVFTSVTFWVLLVLGTFNAVGGLLFNEVPVFGTPTLPVTRVVIDILIGAFGIVPIVIAIFYAADLMWRDRSLKFHEIVDATPTPSWAFLFPKFLAIAAVVFVVLALGSLTGIIVQASKGYTDFEIGQYATRFLYQFGWPIVLIAALALFFQVVFNNRYLGLLAMVVYVVAEGSFDALGFEHNLYQYAGSPGAPYSDMNGYGHFLGIVNWFNLYWTFFAAFLLTLTFLLWNRGALTSIIRRVRDLPSTLTPASAMALGFSLFATAGLGGWIYYNTNILNTYQTSKDEEQLAVDYEQTYGETENDPQPKIVDVSVNVDIFPHERRYSVTGQYILENRANAPIDRIQVSYNPGVEISAQNLAGGEIGEADPKHNVYFFDLANAMAPGEKRTLNFETRVAYKGFRNRNNGVTLVHNGTFLNNNEAFPFIGFVQARLLTDRNDRRKYDLPEMDRMPKLEDKSQYQTNALRNDSDFVGFEAIVSTAKDQTAIAPGYLEREWMEGDRRYFHYKMDVPIQNFFSIQSARYTVAEDQWRDVAIQVFYHEPHDINVERMIDATKKALAYFSENFSPFQYRQMRIIEFPYRSFAQSFPNTVPFSENIGFIADTSDPDEVDAVFYVTAHEVAHQWWGHQVTAANVQGATMLIESLSQYSAFMVVEKEFGRDHVRDFLKLELDRYLGARGTERIEELPLYRVENQQYIHYQKGSLVFYALRDYLGEAVVNRALARLVDLRQYSADPYPTTLDFMRLIREEAGPVHDQLITDLFEKITIYDLEAERATVTERDDGRFDVTFSFAAQKFYADGEGRETPAEISIPMDIGIFSEDPADSDFEAEDVLYLEKHKIDPDNPVITVAVDRRPTHVGIDPYIKLIDRDPDNNVTAIDG